MICNRSGGGSRTARPASGRGLQFAISMLSAAALLLQPFSLMADPVTVRYTEGVVHGFLLVRTTEGTVIGDGELVQIARGDRVTAHLTLRFKDSSVYEETSAYSQRGKFKLLSYRLVQKGPSFKRATDLTMDPSTGQVAVNYSEEDGKTKKLSERMDLPPDVANGIIFTAIKSYPAKAPQMVLSMLASTPKPRIVKLLIRPQGKEAIVVGTSTYQATKYSMKVVIGGAAGVVAPLVGKQPPDIHVWILAEGAPVFLKSEGPLFDGGPIWRIELAIPEWTAGKAPNATKGESKSSQ